mmetsp:Transcript_24866/g.57121  ORF Transcript_24866/g.57121 Transcript_24866/m.57121 type:complete len:122 (-) Transcript_24866:715-1080(-)
MYSIDGPTLLRETDYSKMDMISPTYLVWYLLQKYLAQDLGEALDEDIGTVLKMGHVLESFQVDDASGLVKVRVRNRNDDTTSEVTSRVLVGADGIHSTVRTQLFGSKELRYHNKMMFRAIV